jgi:hypothetical protein
MHSPAGAFSEVCVLTPLSQVRPLIQDRRCVNSIKIRQIDRTANGYDKNVQLEITELDVFDAIPGGQIRVDRRK